VPRDASRGSVEGLDVRYGSAVSSKGYAIRTYTTRSSGATGKLPVSRVHPVAFLRSHRESVRPSRRLGKDARNGDARIEDASGAHRETGRGRQHRARLLEQRPGRGHGGVPGGHSRRAGDPGADPRQLYLFGGSIGAALVPILAQEFQPRGIIATGGFSRTWYEHMLDIERRRLTLSGREGERSQRGDEGLRGVLRPHAAQRPDAGAGDRAESRARPFWYDAPTHQYGRPMRYYQQVQALDVEGAWEKVAVPTLIVWGEYDWIMGRDESDRAAAIVKARDPALVTYVIRPAMDHHFDVYPDPRQAFAEEGGTYDAAPRASSSTGCGRDRVARAVSRRTYSAMARNRASSARSAEASFQYAACFASQPI
jgi:hypothetical protein